MFKIQSLKDAQLINAGVGAAAAIGTAVLPGIGTIIGSVAGVLTSALNILFGGSKNVSNNNFVDSIVKSAQNLGIIGLTHDDVVHLLPGNWGTDRSNALNVFDYYLGVIQGTKTGLSGSLLTPGSDAEYELDFGGGYQAGHPIYYQPSKVSPQIIAATQTTLPTSNQSSILPSGNVSNILLIGGGIILLYILSQK